MKKKTVLIVFAFLAMIATVAATVNAKQWTVGVKAGDWGEYSVTMGSITSGFCNGTVKIEVTNVESTTIYYSLTFNAAIPVEYNMSSGSIDVSNSARAK